ncbi:MAG: hypothetical protein U0640_12460 [Phycisphaerales bacterium]
MSFAAVDNSPAPTSVPSAAKASGLGLRPLVGRTLRELRLHLDRWGQQGDLPRAVFFANQNWDDSASSNFRCAQIAAGLRSLGWRTTCVPPHLSFDQRMRLLKLERPNIIYIQNARNERNQPKLYSQIAPCVFDFDDADYEVPHVRERYENAVRDAAAVTVGSHFLADWAKPLNANVHVVWTSHPAPPAHATIPQSQRKPVIGWAQNGWANYQREKSIVREVLIRAHELTPCDFHLFAVKDVKVAEEFVAPLRGAGINCEFVSYLSNNDFIARLEQVAVGLHALDPSDVYSRAKSFGKLLSYSAARVAIVASNNLETPRGFTHGENALLCNNSEEMALAAASLLKDAPRREQLGEAAARNLSARFSPATVCKKIDSIFRDVIASRKA